MAIAANAILMAGCDADSTMASTALPPVDDPPVAMGSVGSETSTPCPLGAPANARCTSVSVSCPRLSPLSVVIATTEPTDVAASATLVLHDYVGGTEFLDDGLVDAHRAAGFRIVQPKWQTD